MASHKTHKHLWLAIGLVKFCTLLSSVVSLLELSVFVKNQCQHIDPPPCFFLKKAIMTISGHFCRVSYCKQRIGTDRKLIRTVTHDPDDQFRKPPCTVSDQFAIRKEVGIVGVFRSKTGTDRHDRVFWRYFRGGCRREWKRSTANRRLPCAGSVFFYSPP